MQDALLVMPLVTLAAGALFGMLVERHRWNVLIRKGVLPRPGERR